jgi:hypothetical protein
MSNPRLHPPHAPSSVKHLQLSNSDDEFFDTDVTLDRDVLAVLPSCLQEVTFEDFALPVSYLHSYFQKMTFLPLLTAATFTGEEDDNEEEWQELETMLAKQRPNLEYQRR